MPVHRYMEENGLATILAAKISAGVTPEVSLKKHVTHMPLPNMKRAAYSGFETQRRHHQKSKKGISVAPQKGLLMPSNFFKMIIFDVFSDCITFSKLTESQHKPPIDPHHLHPHKLPGETFTT